MTRDAGFVTEAALVSYLDRERISRIRCERELPSTNTVLMQEIAGGAEYSDGYVLTADAQSAGRGRLGRSFVSPAGRGIYLSYLLKPCSKSGESDRVESWLDITSKSAVAAALAINDVYGVIPRIKWVNDLYLDGRKICGILTQMIPGDSPGSVAGIVTGIGINVNGTREDLPEDLREKATYLYEETGVRKELPELAASLIKRLDMLKGDRAWFLERYREYCPVPGRKLILGSPCCASPEELAEHPERGVEAEALYIDDDFSLVVRMKDGSERALAGEEILKVDMRDIS